MEKNEWYGNWEKNRTSDSKKKTHPNAIDHRIAFFYGLHEKMAEKMAENGFCSSKNIDGTHSFPFVFFFFLNAK